MSVRLRWNPYWITFNHKPSTKSRRAKKLLKKSKITWADDDRPNANKVHNVRNILFLIILPIHTTHLAIVCNSRLLLLMFYFIFFAFRLFRLHFWSTMRSRWLAASLRLLLLCKLVNSMPSINSTLKINPKPCTANGYGGTCMFVWECIKSEGQHIGMCVDSFMFGSCCALNLTENIVLTQHQHFDFKPPIRKPRPPNASNRPNLRWEKFQRFVNLFVRRQNRTAIILMYVGVLCAFNQE